MIKVLVASVLCTFAFTSGASIITLTPDDCDDFGGSVACESGPETSNSEILDIIESFYPGLVEVYKSNVDGGEDGSYPYADDYTTTFSNTSDDPMDALIEWDGSDSISCPDCFVLVKDGNQNPAWYLFDIGTWDGTSDIDLQNFWPTNGAISHVSLFQASVVPVPAAVWLFGSGLLGLVGVARRKNHA